MASNKSFCNRTLVIDACRSTLWVGFAYLAVGLLNVVPQMLTYHDAMPWDYVTSISDLEIAMLAQAPVAFGLMAMLFAWISTGIAFGFLFKRSASEFYGSVPVRRGAVFSSSFLAALLPLLAADVIIVCVMTVVGMPMGFRPQAALMWLFIVASMDFICVSMATICIQFTGSKPFFAAVYLMAHGLIFALETGLYSLMDIFTLGLPSLGNNSYGVLAFLSPMLEIATRCPSYFFTAGQGFGPAATCIAPYLVVAAVLTIAACALFQRRGFERSGDGITFPKARPVIAVLFAVGAGMLFSELVLALFNVTGSGNGYGNSFSITLFLVSFVGGSVVAYAFFEMILAKTVGVLKKRAVGLAVVACLTAVVGAGVAFDVAGFTDRIPAVNDIQSVRVDNVTPNITDDACIAEAINVHREVIAVAKEDAVDGQKSNWTDSTPDTDNITFTYMMNNGQSKSYRYSIFTSERTGSKAAKAQQGVVALVNSETVTNAIVTDARAIIEQYCQTKAAASLSHTRSDGVNVELSIPKDKLLQLYDEALSKDLREQGTAGELGFNDKDLDYSSKVYLGFNMQDSFEYSDQNQYFISRIMGMDLSKERTPNTVKWLNGYFKTDIESL